MQVKPDEKQDFSIYYLSENSVTLTFGQEISETLLQRISNFNKQIHQNPFSGFYTTVPAYTTLSVFFNPVEVIKSALPGADCFEKASAYLQNLEKEPVKEVLVQTAVITVPVCYDAEFGTDLEEVASQNQLTVPEVIELHSSAIYTVYMLGFIPGFAYLGGLDERLATPRKATPRKVIPAGAVGIAGKQTGIYPLETPGGWQLIGRTPVKLFDPAKKQPALLNADDRVVFKAISKQEFQLLQQS